MTPVEQFEAIQRRIDILKNRPAYAYNALSPEQEEIINEILDSVREHIMSDDTEEFNLTFNQTIRKEVLVSWHHGSTVHNLTVSHDRQNMSLTTYDEADFDSDETIKNLGAYDLEKIASLIKSE